MEGLGEVLHLAESYGLPSIVTENGTQPTDTSADDFLRPHLQSLLDAKDEGVDVRGYFYWSLLDNYEWNHGMDYRFGLYAVDVATKDRTLRPMGAAYAEIAAAGAL
jgi:beta-glucosidase